jgi:hypothetical protein
MQKPEIPKSNQPTANDDAGTAPPWPVGWDEHRREEIIHTALNSTPEQRMRWLEDMLELLRPQLPKLWANRERERKREHELLLRRERDRAK